MAKHIILIHGRSFKPARHELERLWLEALRHGLARDHPDSLTCLDQATISFVYYGHHSNAFLEQATDQSQPNDVASRQRTLDQLKRYGAADFTRANYESLPHSNGWKEFLADMLGGPLAAIRMSDRLIEYVAPDVREYWNDESTFGSDLRYVMTDPLKQAMGRDDEILVISHSLGTMIAYDTFWKFSRTGEYRPNYTDKKIDLWLTLGSPLADETVKRHLKGSRASGERRYPSNIQKWVNVAAEDDYISHDQGVANDFKAMKSLGLVDAIVDKRIYNLAVRDGRSNPHHGAGYLVHPYVARTVADWLMPSDRLGDRSLTTANPGWRGESSSV